MDFEQLARATVQIRCGNSRGSGFHFIKPDFVVTNHHVIVPKFSGAAAITVLAEGGSRSEADLVAYSDQGDKDFAILKLHKALGADRVALSPTSTGYPPRGLEVAYAGYP